MRLTKVAARGWAIAAALLVAANAPADEAFYRVPIGDLKFTAGELPGDSEDNALTLARILNLQSSEPRAVIDGEGEVYVQTPGGENPWMKSSERAARDSLVIRLAGPRKMTGTLFWPRNDRSGFVKLPFVVEAEPSGEAKTEFFAAKQAYYAGLMKRGLAGAAWFRHQVRELRRDAGKPVDEAETGAANRDHNDPFDQTFGLMSGGRAISENLQLDRVLKPGAGGEELVPLDSLPGISVAEIDWKPLIKGMQPATDRLAALVPADQHVVLFPSFSAFAEVGDRLAQQGTVVMRLAAPRTGDPRLMARYEDQLCLSLRGPGRIVGPQVIGSVALTGSDPYFQPGTDVALVFETAQPEMLKNLLLSQVFATANATPSAKKVEGKIGMLSYSGMRSPDRQISSYVAALDGAVLVTNSLYQLERFAAVASGREPAIAPLDEFTFFRNRYPRGDKDESALLFISDATIRRWCGPRWRIGASRVLRSAAVLAELQAANMDKLVKKPIAAAPLKTDLPLAGGGELTLTADGVQSSALGNLAFMTPIAELKFDKVTRAEADAYNRWRADYQNKWRWAFDPIALRLGVTDNRLAADLTVMPLIAGSEFRQWIPASRGAAIAPDAGDRHHSIVQLILAINTKSDVVRGNGNVLAGLVPGVNRDDPLPWLGQSISLYVDYDSFWNDLAACKTDQERVDFVIKNLRRIPIALWFEVSDGPKLKQFLDAARAVAEKTAPAETWESLDYLGRPYVRIRYGKNPIGGWQLCYAATDKFLLLTPSEALLKQAINRQIAVEAAEKAAAGQAAAPQDASAVAAAKAPAEKPAPADQAAAGPKRELRPWLGTNAGVQVDHKLFALLLDSLGETYQQWMQTQSWNNLPILNEWHGLYPDQDPAALHERIWHTRLVCPGGGQYVWNEAWQTMESSVYGHPGEPKAGPAAEPELLDFRFANFGLTFEGDGLRARLTLDRKTPAGKPREAK
jgi:hypothetical protein